MIASAPLMELLLRLGSELDFDVARDVGSGGGTVDIVWFCSSLPIAAVAAEPLDLRDAPVLPIVAFIAGTTATFEATDLAGTIARLRNTGAPLRIIVIARDSRQAALAPALHSVEGLKKQDADVALRTRIAAALCADAHGAGRTIAMLQSEVVEWARRVREIRPRSYSAESLFNRTGAID
jgi:hypothetical protein